MSYACTASSLKPLSLRYSLMPCQAACNTLLIHLGPTVKPAKEALYPYITPD